MLAGRRRGCGLAAVGGIEPQARWVSSFHFLQSVRASALLTSTASVHQRVCSRPLRAWVELRLRDSDLPEALRLCDWKAEALSPDLPVTPSSPTRGLSVTETILIIQR